MGFSGYTYTRKYQYDQHDHPSKDRLNDFTGVLQSKVKSLCLEDHRQENNLMTSD